MLTRRTFITTLACIPLFSRLTENTERKQVAWKELFADPKYATLYGLNSQHPLAKGLVFASFGTKGQSTEPPNMVIVRRRIFC